MSLRLPRGFSDTVFWPEFLEFGRAAVDVTEATSPFLEFHGRAT